MENFFISDDKIIFLIKSKSILVFKGSIRIVLLIFDNCTRHKIGKYVSTL